MAEWCADLRAQCRLAVRDGVSGITGPHDPETLLQCIGRLTDAIMDIDQVAADMQTVIRQHNGHAARWRIINNPTEE